MGSSAHTTAGESPMSSHANANRLRSPPLTPRVFASPTRVSAHFVSPRRRRASSTAAARSAGERDSRGARNSAAVWSVSRTVSCE